jgi:hypothetical protein
LTDLDLQFHGFELGILLLFQEFIQLPPHTEGNAKSTLFTCKNANKFRMTILVNIPTAEDYASP